MWNPLAWVLRRLRGAPRPVERLEGGDDEAAANADAGFIDIGVEAPPLDDGEAVRPSIWVNIKLSDDELLTDADHELHYQIENAIEERGVGDWYGSGYGEGWMDVAFIVREGDSVQSAVSAVRAILRELNVPEDRVRIDIFND